MSTTTANSACQERFQSNIKKEYLKQETKRKFEVKMARTIAKIVNRV